MADNQLIRDVANINEVLATAYYTYNTYINAIKSSYSKIMSGRLNRDQVASEKAKIDQLFITLDQYTKYFGSNVNKFNKQTTPQLVARIYGNKSTAESLIEDIIKLADYFDNAGHYKISNRTDNFLKSIVASDLSRENIKTLVCDIFAVGTKLGTKLIDQIVALADLSDDIGAHSLASELDKIAKEVSEPIQHPEEGSLSTRYCPDHKGVQAIRISEHVYQCPIDGKTYNYETGYVNYQGQEVPGGSVAAQTSTTSDFGGIPMRIYDSRQNVLNRIN